MKFKYISKSPEAPNITTILGHTFKLDGDAIEAKDTTIIKKFKGMAHIGIIPVEEEEKSEMELLKEKADSLNIEYKGNISKKALKELIDGAN